MTIDDLRKNVERQILVSRCSARRSARSCSITEEEARQYYRRTRTSSPSRRPSRCARSWSRCRRRRRAGRPASTSAQDDEAEEKAAAIRARARRPARTSRKVAAEVSAAPSKANGGLIGPINVDGALAGAAGAARQDEAGRHHRSRSARTRGYQILKLETLEAGGDAAVRERARPRRRQGVTTRAAGRGAQVPRAACAAQAIIEWKNDELKKAYEQGARDARRRAGH